MKYRCTVCGYIHDGSEAPEACPKCNAPKEKFEALTTEAAALIDRSRKTNMLYAKLSALLSEAQQIAAEGIEDNLDPSCSKIFKGASDEFNTIQQRIKAEIAGHISKGKWG